MFLFLQGGAGGMPPPHGGHGGHGGHGAHGPHGGHGAMGAVRGPAPLPHHPGMPPYPGTHIIFIILLC